MFFLTLANTIGLTYLTYLIYKKNNSTSKNNTKTLISDRNFKISLHRYNPFDDLGGDQSFILCLLDNTNSGAIITSLHHRENTRIYAKSIKNGQSQEMPLSEEETKALIKTVNS